MLVGNISSWSKVVSEFGFQALIEATSGPTYYKPFSNRLAYL